MSVCVSVCRCVCERERGRALHTDLLTPLYMLLWEKAGRQSSPGLKLAVRTTCLGRGVYAGWREQEGRKEREVGGGQGALITLLV